MENELKIVLEEILKELKYHSKLLEEVYQGLDSHHHHNIEVKQDLKKLYDDMVKSIMQHPGFQKVPELKKIFENMIDMGVPK